MDFFKKLPNYLAQGIIVFYRKVLSPILYAQDHCMFYPTCSEYALECFKKYPFWTALRKSTNRISRCHPGNEPGVDLP